MCVCMCNAYKAALRSQWSHHRFWINLKMIQFNGQRGFNHDLNYFLLSLIYYRKLFECDIVITKLINKLSATVELLHSSIAIVFVNIFCVKCLMGSARLNRQLPLFNQADSINTTCYCFCCYCFFFFVTSNEGSEGHYIWSPISNFLFSFIFQCISIDYLLG